METIELIEKVERLGLETKCDEHKIEINDKKGRTVCLINRKHCFIFTTDYYVNESFPYSFKEALLEIVLQYASTPIEEREKVDEKMKFTKDSYIEKLESLLIGVENFRFDVADVADVDEWKELTTNILKRAIAREKANQEAEIHNLDDATEKVEVPEFIANYLCRAKTDIGLMRVFEIANTKNELGKWKKEYNWIRKNSEKFAKAWIDGYQTIDSKNSFDLNSLTFNNQL